MKEKYPSFIFNFNAEIYGQKYDSIGRTDLEYFKNSLLCFISLNFEEQKKES